MLLKGVVGGCDEKRVESRSRELVSRATVVVKSKDMRHEKLCLPLPGPLHRPHSVPRSNFGYNYVTIKPTRLSERSHWWTDTSGFPIFKTAVSNIGNPDV
jgi:hypothetical protein